MTSAQLAELNGLLALETQRRANAGDKREKDIIADDVLREALAPPIGRMLDRIALMIGLGLKRVAGKS